MLKNMLLKAIHKSQHVQRNWDLSKSIPQEDLEIIEQACLGAPSKQNVTFFKPYFITDRNIINKIHRNTLGFLIEDGKKGGVATKGDRLTTNPQVLANLLGYAPSSRSSGRLCQYDSGYARIQHWLLFLL